MMDSMRKHMKKVMWVIAGVFIAGIFFWYGTGQRMDDTVARGANFEINVQDYQQQVSRQLRAEREETDGELSDNQIFKIRRQVLSSMINEEIIYNQAKKMGIGVTDKEVIDTVRRLPQFQHEGQFNMQMYTRALQHSMNMTPAEFEEMIRKNITTQKVERLVLATANTTLTELQLRYESEHGTLVGFEEKKEELQNNIIQEKRSNIYRNWISQLHQKADLDINPQLANLEQPPSPQPTPQP